MRHLIFTLLFTLPLYAGANVTMSHPLTENRSTPSVLSMEGADQKHGFLKRFVIKNGQKQIAKNLARFNTDNGRNLCIAGYTIGLLVTIFSILFFALTATYGLGFLIAYILVSLAGLYMSILGLKKARKHEKTRRIRNFAIAGIILNSLFSILGILFLIWAIGYTQ